MKKSDVMKAYRPYRKDIYYQLVCFKTELQFTIWDYNGREITTDVNAFMQWLKENANDVYEAKTASYYYFDDISVSIAYESKDRRR
jgi:hypothetical protein